MSDPVKVGIVGLGQRGLQHLRALWQIREAKIVALCDPIAGNLEEAKIQHFVDCFSLESIATHQRFEAMLDADLDAIYFAIPPNLHAGEVVAAARAGLAVFAEKPVSLYYDEALEMERVIRNAGVVATVGFQQRHDRWNIAIRDFLQDKRMVMATAVTNGSLESHSVKHSNTVEHGGPQNRVWAASMAWSGTSVVEGGIHPLDLMRFWCGDIAWARSDYIHRDADDIEDGGDNPYAYSVSFGFESGMVYNLLLSRLRRSFYSDSYFDIMWDRGHLKLESEGPVAYYYDGLYPPESTPSVEELRHPLPADDGRGDATLAVNQAFIDAVARGEESGLLNTFSSSLNSHAAVLVANVSDQLGGRKIDLKVFAESDEYAPFRSKPRRH